MPDHIDRSEGRRLFGADPSGYTDARPDYPRWVFERLRDTGALLPGTPTLEIGPGTGMATRALLEFGADPLTLVEPDARFARSLGDLTRSFPANCQLVNAAFEDCNLGGSRFGLIASATAFHWIDQAAGLRRIHNLLPADGRVALFWNVLQVLGQTDAFHDATQVLLAPLATSPSGAPGAVPFALDRAARKRDATAAGFAHVDCFESHWNITLTGPQVRTLYAGFSSIQRLPDDARRGLLEQLQAIAEREFDGRVERNVTTIAYVLRP